MLCCVMAQPLQSFAVLLAAALSNIGPAQVASVSLRPQEIKAYRGEKRPPKQLVVVYRVF